MKCVERVFVRCCVLLLLICALELFKIACGKALREFRTKVAGTGDFIRVIFHQQHIKVRIIVYNTVWR